MNNSFKNTALLFLCCLSLSGIAEEWEVPAAAQKKSATYAFDQASQDAGEKIYNANCASCHGQPTKGNFQPLTPIPGDLATKRFVDQSDGELYFKITNGRGLMPQFKTVLSNEERWKPNPERSLS